MSDLEEPIQDIGSFPNNLNFEEKSALQMEFQKDTVGSKESLLSETSPKQTFSALKVKFEISYASLVSHDKSGDVTCGQNGADIAAQLGQRLRVRIKLYQPLASSIISSVYAFVTQVSSLDSTHYCCLKRRVKLP
jgi:hypothetical protein